jgi:hypothetical protein
VIGARDGSNNVGRRCTLAGDTRPRQWLVIGVLLGGGYVLSNGNPDEIRVACLKDMHHLY